MAFKDPLFLIAFIPFLGFAIYYWLKRLNRREVSLPLSSTKLASAKKTLRSVSYPYVSIFRFISIGLLLFALARPGKGIDFTEVSSFGVDIMIVQDISVSMLGVDFKPEHRLNVSKLLMRDFVSKRKSDRLGLVLFAGEAYLQSPLTNDYGAIDELLNDIEYDAISEQGTAIGNAIALAVSRLIESETKSKIILLVTDGASNRGLIEPQTAAELAKEYGIKIYVIGVGSGQETVARIPGQGFLRIGVSFNEEELKAIADISGGKYYRATTENEYLEYINEIDALEKSRFKVKQYHEFDDKWMPYLLAAALFFLAEILLRAVLYRKIP